LAAGLVLFLIAPSKAQNKKDSSKATAAKGDNKSAVKQDDDDDDEVADTQGSGQKEQKKIKDDESDKGKEAAEKEKKFRFSKEDIGKIAKGWTAAKTGKGEGSIWKVVTDESSPSKTGFVLAQTAKSPGGLFNICIVDDTKFKDVEASVAFKANAGKIDQGGGLVWRYQDANNYYIARYNPLETNFRLYYVIDGKRVQLAGKEGLDMPAGKWHTMKIEHKGDNIECYLNGKKLLEAKSDMIQKAGKVGLWSKADAQSSFDDLEVEVK
jgi:hypothetical protein